MKQTNPCHIIGWQWNIDQGSSLPITILTIVIDKHLGLRTD